MPPLRRPLGDVAALAAGALLVARVELFVDARDRVLVVVGHLAHRLVERRAALLAEPLEAVELLAAALALEDEQEGVGREARRVRDAGRAVHDLALLQDEDLLLALRSAVVQVHLAL